MRKLDAELQERLEQSRLRLLKILAKGSITPDILLRKELQIYVAMRYGAIRFAWGLLWQTFKAELRTRWLLWCYRDIETWSAEKMPVVIEKLDRKIAKLDRKIEKCSGLKFNQN